jgi:hypothetical protein
MVLIKYDIENEIFVSKFRIPVIFLHQEQQTQIYVWKLFDGNL